MEVVCVFLPYSGREMKKGMSTVSDLFFSDDSGE